MAPNVTYSIRDSIPASVQQELQTLFSNTDPSKTTISQISSKLEELQLQSVVDLVHIPVEPRETLSDLTNQLDAVGFVYRDGKLYLQKESAVLNDLPRKLYDVPLNHISPSEKDLHFQCILKERELNEAGHIYRSYDVNMEVCVATLTGARHTVNVNSNNSIEDLRYIFQEASGIPPDQQRFIFQGKQLESDRLLSDYNIQEKDTIHLVLRLRGGMHHVTSGRLDYDNLDYCSTDVPDVETYQDTVDATRISISYKDKSFGRTKCLTLHAHPKCTIETVQKSFLAEIERSQRGSEKVQSPSFSRNNLLSRSALFSSINSLLSQPTDLFTIDMDEEDGEEDGEDKLDDWSSLFD